MRDRGYFRRHPRSPYWIQMSESPPVPLGTVTEERNHFLRQSSTHPQVCRSARTVKAFAEDTSAWELWSMLLRAPFREGPAVRSTVSWQIPVAANLRSLQHCPQAFTATDMMSTERVLEPDHSCPGQDSSLRLSISLTKTFLELSLSLCLPPNSIFLPSLSLFVGVRPALQSIGSLQPAPILSLFYPPHVYHATNPLHVSAHLGACFSEDLNWGSLPWPLNGCVSKLECKCDAWCPFFHDHRIQELAFSAFISRGRDIFLSKFEGRKRTKPSCGQQLRAHKAATNSIGRKWCQFPSSEVSETFKELARCVFDRRWPHHESFEVIQSLDLLFCLPYPATYYQSQPCAEWKEHSMWNTMNLGSQLAPAVWL